MQYNLIYLEVVSFAIDHSANLTDCALLPTLLCGGEDRFSPSMTEQSSDNDEPLLKHDDLLLKNEDLNIKTTLKQH